MKFNKWTLGLAAVGAVSMASVVRAEEAPKLVPLNTALSSTVISGNVDVAAQYNMGENSQGSVVPAGTSPSKVDAFSLNDVDIALDKPMDESPWAAGYHAELNYGVNAVGVSLTGSQANTAAGTAGTTIRQAYVALRTPVGNGIDWKIGVQDDVLSYESNTDGANPNYTRSIGYSVDPTTLLGMIGSYKIIEEIVVQAGIADATSPGSSLTTYPNPAFGRPNINSTPTDSDKTFVGAVTFIAPDSFGFAKGATLSFATLLNLDHEGQDNYNVSLTMPTPSSMIKVGAAFDFVSIADQHIATATINPPPPPFHTTTIGANPNNDSGWVAGLYTSITPTDKLSFNLRGEYFDLPGGTLDPYIATLGSNPPNDGQGEEVTATVQYDLWANVISRLEFRWDHLDSGRAFGYPTASNGSADSYLLAANIIYTF